MPNEELSILAQVVQRLRDELTHRPEAITPQTAAYLARTADRTAAALWQAATVHYPPADTATVAIEHLDNLSRAVQKLQGFADENPGIVSPPEVSDLSNQLLVTATQFSRTVTAMKSHCPDSATKEIGLADIASVTAAPKLGPWISVRLKNGDQLTGAMVEELERSADAAGGLDPSIPVYRKA
jgi:hypothetical protein